MQTFRFRLERVLGWYRKKCRIEENLLAERVEELSRLEARIARFQAERLRIERDVLSRREIAAADFSSLGRYRLRACELDAEFAVERRRTEAALTQQRSRTQTAQRKVKLVEKLRERQLANYTVAADRELETLAAEAYLSKITQAKS